MTLGAFTDALPEPASTLPLHPYELDEVAGWRAASGPLLGRDLQTTIVPLVSIKDGEEYAIAKLLHVEMRGVHVRIYADRFGMPPEELNPWSLSLDRWDAPNFSYGHMPLSRASFAAMEPGYERLVMCSTDELDGYRMWKEGKGGWF